MELLSLPTELFEAVLHRAIVVRGIKRGLRLRLVNKTFARAVMQALYTFRLLDDLCVKRIRLLDMSILGSYLAYRVRHEPANGNPLLNCIERVAKDVFEKRDVDDPELTTVEACVDKLCSSLGSSTGKLPDLRFKEIFQRESDVSEDEYEEHLFAAAIRTNTLSIVRQCATKNKQLLSKLKGLFIDNLIFGWYDELAAKYGNKQLLEYLLTIGVPTVNKGLRAEFFSIAARAGRAEIVQFLYDFKREEVPWNFGDIFGSGPEVLYRAQWTASHEVLTFVRELNTVYQNPKFSEWDLTHLIQLGAHPEGSNYMGGPRHNEPIRYAAIRGHVAIVELLLEYGADPKRSIAAAAEWGRTELVQRLLHAGITPVNALTKAAAGGYLGVVRLLLDAGVDANESIGSESPLAGAIAREHTAMFKLLLERGADLHSTGTAEECVQRARKDGLESMLLLLEAHGVDIGD